jgi:hypothetical protein
MLVIVDGLPGRDEEAEGRQPLQQQVAIVEQLPALVVFTRTVGAGTERRPDVLQVMTHDASAVLADHGVERVPGFHVDEIGPRAEHLERAQLAAMFMGHDVVRIVGARAVVTEAADGPARHRARGDGAVAAVAAAMCASQHGVEIADAHRPLATGHRRERSPCRRCRARRA